VVKCARLFEMGEGGLTRESRTGIRLVSQRPTRGCEKKKKDISLEILLASTDAIESGTTPGKPVKPDSK